MNILNASHGWVLAPSPMTASTRLNLHPDQAQELAACAHDLMKQAMEEKAKESAKLLSRDISTKLKRVNDDEEECLIDENDQEICGPVSWARKRLWPFKQAWGSGTAPSVASKLP